MSPILEPGSAASLCGLALQPQAATDPSGSGSLRHLPRLLADVLPSTG